RKEYEAEVVLGVETDTLDADGRVTGRTGAEGLTEGALRAALAQLQGPQKQAPPMYSAVRHEGRRLYELAREGREAPRKARDIHVYALALGGFAPGGAEARARISIACSKGTYVRVIASDLGRLLGTGGHLSQLRRVRSGPFSIDQAVPLDQVAEAPLWPL